MADDLALLVPDDLSEAPHPQPGVVLAHHAMGEAARLVALFEDLDEAIPVIWGLVEIGYETSDEVVGPLIAEHVGQRRVGVYQFAVGGGAE